MKQSPAAFRQSASRSQVIVGGYDIRNIVRIASMCFRARNSEIILPWHYENRSGRVHERTSHTTSPTCDDFPIRPDLLASPLGAWLRTDRKARSQLCVI